MVVDPFLFGACILLAGGLRYLVAYFLHRGDEATLSDDVREDYWR